MVYDVLAAMEAPMRADEIAILGVLDRLISGRVTEPLEAVRVAHAVARGAERALADRVTGAREAGHTWSEIGDVLGTSRQAVFQRFGRPVDPRTGRPMVRVSPEMGERAMRLLADMAAGRVETVCSSFDETVLAKVDPDRLTAAWAQVISAVGTYLGLGTPHGFHAGDVTVVEVPLRFEAGERTGRVTYSRAGRVVGLHFLRIEGGR
jgi:hypothetical protein